MATSGAKKLCRLSDLVASQLSSQYFVRTSMEYTRWFHRARLKSYNVDKAGNYRGYDLKLVNWTHQPCIFTIRVVYNRCMSSAYLPQVFLVCFSLITANYFNVINYSSQRYSLFVLHIAFFLTTTFTSSVKKE